MRTALNPKESALRGAGRPIILPGVLTRSRSLGGDGAEQQARGRRSRYSHLEAGGAQIERGAPPLPVSGWPGSVFAYSRADQLPHSRQAQPVMAAPCLTFRPRPAMAAPS